MHHYLHVETVRLDALVNDVYHFFKHHFVEGEIVQCKLNNYKYVDIALKFQIMY